MSTTARTSEQQAFETSPLDFGSYLARRLGTDPATATRALGAWLARYERTDQRGVTHAARRIENDRP